METSRRLILVAAIVLTATSRVARAQEVTANRPTSKLVSSRIEERVVKYFDFDEQKAGNYESTPMNWRQLVGPGFPRFSEPRLDRSMGHDSAPSFKLAVSGGSLGCVYHAGDIPVHPDSDYEITAWVRGEGLHCDSAGLAAYFLDHAMQPIESSRARVEFAADDSGNLEWTTIRIVLHGGFQQARWIGLSVNVGKPQMRKASSERPRPINRQDVRAAAWFDDIRVVRLPNVLMELSDPTGVFRPSESADCRIRVADLDGNGLQAEFAVIDADGTAVRRNRVPIVEIGGAIEPMAISGLPPGRYVARLTVHAEAGPLLTRECFFAQLGPDLPCSTKDNAFGIMLDDSATTDPVVTARLIGLLNPKWVKINLWRRDTSDADVVEGNPANERLVRSLQESHRQIVGVLEAPPPSLLQTFGHPRHNVLDVLAKPAERWRPYAAFVFARYGERVRAWQLGSDSTAPTIDHAQLAAAMKNVKLELEPLVGPSHFAAPQDVLHVPETKSPDSELQSVFVPDHIAAENLKGQLGGETQSKNEQWVVLEPLGPEFERESRLIEYARRIVAARCAVDSVVFLPQPWSMGGPENRAAPGEEFVLLRTLMQALGVRKYQGRVHVGTGVQGELFGEDDSQDGVLLAWRDGALGEPSKVRIEATGATRVFDAWGRAQYAAIEADGATVGLSAMPTVVTGVRVGRYKTQGSCKLMPEVLTLGIQPREAHLVLTNHFNSRMTGQLTFHVPEGWEISPWRTLVDVLPGGKLDLPIELQLPSNQAAGPHAIIAELRSENPEMKGLQLRAAVRIDTPGLDVSVLTSARNGKLCLIQRITNHTKRPLDLRCTAVIPNRPSQTRFIRQLAPGQTTLREYELEGVAAVLNRDVRVSVEEVDGPIRRHDLVRVRTAPKPVPAQESAEALGAAWGSGLSSH